MEPGNFQEVPGVNRPAARAFRDHVRAAGAPRRDPSLDVHVAELRDPALRHRLGEAAELVRGRVVVDRACLDLQRCAPSSGTLASSGTLGAALILPKPTGPTAGATAGAGARAEAKRRETGQETGKDPWIC